MISAKVQHADGLVTVFGVEESVAPAQADVYGELATGDVLTGTASFDNFRLSGHKDDAACCPDCGAGRCLQHTDAFDRTALGCFWAAVSGSWTLNAVAQRLQVNPGGALVLIDNVLGHGASVRIQAALTVPAGGAARIYVGRTSTAHYAAEIEVASSGCGTLRLVSRTGGGDATLGWDVPIPDLAPDVPHTVRLCYSSETRLLAAVLITAAGASYGHHAAVGSLPGDIAGLGAGSASGEYAFDDWQMWQHAAADRPDCPCCTLPGCEGFSDTFVGGTLDCRWLQQAGTWTETGGNVEAVASDAILLALASWSGLDDYCDADPTQFAEVSFTAQDYGDQARVIVDWLDASHYHYAELRHNPSQGVNGTLKLFKVATSVATELASRSVAAPPDQSHTLRVCYDQERLTAVFGSAVLEEESDGHGGLRAAIGTGSITAKVQFHAASFSHDLWHVNCPDCVGVGDCVYCAGGEAPYYVKTRFVGIGPGTNRPAHTQCVDINRTYLNQFQGGCIPDEIGDCSVVLPPGSEILPNGTEIESIAWSAVGVDEDYENLGNPESDGVVVKLFREIGARQWHLAVTKLFTVHVPGAVVPRVVSVVWSKPWIQTEVDEPPNCYAIDGVVLPFHHVCNDEGVGASIGVYWINELCDWTNSTVRINTP